MLFFEEGLGSEGVDCWVGQMGRRVNSNPLDSGPVWLLSLPAESELTSEQLIQDWKMKCWM